MISTQTGWNPALCSSPRTAPRPLPHNVQLRRVHFFSQYISVSPAFCIRIGVFFYLLRYDWLLIYTPTRKHCIVKSYSSFYVANHKREGGISRNSGWEKNNAVTSVRLGLASRVECLSGAPRVGLTHGEDAHSHGRKRRLGKSSH